MTGSRVYRRTFLKGAAVAGLGTAGVGTAGCGAGSADVSGELLTSAARLPEPFRVPLPVPVTARAQRAKDGSDHYELVQRRAEMEILPGLRTEIWGYDGTFPGSTLVGRSRRTTTVRIRNSLPVPTSTHLHGGVQAPSSDGYPMDLVVPSG